MEVQGSIPHSGHRQRRGIHTFGGHEGCKVPEDRCGVSQFLLVGICESVVCESGLKGKEKQTVGWSGDSLNGGRCLMVL